MHPIYHFPVCMSSDLDANPDDAVEDVTSIFRISNEIAKRTERTTSLLLLKSGTCVEIDKPVEDQLYIVRLVRFTIFQNILL